MSTNDSMTPEQSEQWLLREFGIGRLFHLARDGIILANTKTEEIIAWNPGAENIFGYSSAEALRMPLHNLVPESLKDVHRIGIGHYQETGHGNLIDSGRPVEVPACHKDGREISIELSLSPVPKEVADSDRYALAIVRDITDKKESEESERRLFEEKVRQQRAVELNELVLQNLFVAKMNLELGQTEEGISALSDAIQRAKLLTTDLLTDTIGDSE